MNDAVTMKKKGLSHDIMKTFLATSDYKLLVAPYVFLYQRHANLPIQDPLHEAL